MLNKIFRALGLYMHTASMTIMIVTIAAMFTYSVVYFDTATISEDIFSIMIIFYAILFMQMLYNNAFGKSRRANKSQK